MQDLADPGRDRARLATAPDAKTSSAALIYSAEAIGTFMLVLVGTAVATAAALGKGTAGPAYNSLAVALSFGVILTPIVGALGPVSGAHVNPAVTLGLAMAGKFPWRHAPGYMIAQVAGALVAALAVWAIYGHGAYYDSHLGAPSPVNGAGSMQVLLAEALIAFILVLTVLFTATDPRVPPGVAAIAIGAALIAGVFLGGPVSGGAGNPARALGPMIVTGSFPVWFFYVTGPLIGGAVAALVFRLIGKADAPTMSLDGLEGPLETETGPTAGTQTGTKLDISARSAPAKLAGDTADAADDAMTHALAVGETAVREMRAFANRQPVAATLTAMGLGSAIGVALKHGRR